MHSGQSAEADLALEALGPVPSDLVGLIQLYAGSARLVVSEADLLLAGLRDRDGALVAPLSDEVAPPDQVAPVAPSDQVEEKLAVGEVSADRFAHTLAGAAVAIVDQVVATDDQVDSRHQVDARYREQHVEKPEPPVLSRNAAARPFTLDAEALEPRDGPPTRRMNARDVRLGANGRKSTFSGGLLGADDLPEFPLVRGASVKGTDDAKAAPVNNTSVAIDDDTDSFEILVDEEILEIEPDDAIFEESPKQH